MNHCRICLALVPDPKMATTVDSKLSDGSSVAETLDELFGILVGDYSDAVVLKAICDQCLDKITRSVKGVPAGEFDQIKEFLESGEKKARLFVRSGGQIGPAEPINNPALKVITNSPFGMTTPKQAAKRPVIPAAAATTSKKSKLQQDQDATLDWLRSQPGTAGLGGSTPRMATKKVVVREIQLDQDDNDDDRETVVKTKCPFCTKVYVLNSALMTHITAKHPEHPVKFKKCENCNRKFLNAVELKAHKCPKAVSYGRRSYGWFRRGYWW